MFQNDEALVLLRELARHSGSEKISPRVDKVCVVRIRVIEMDGDGWVKAILLCQKHALCNRERLLTDFRGNESL